MARAWTADDVEAALKGALDVYRRLPLGRNDRPAGYGSAWPDIPMDWWEWWNNYNTAAPVIRRPVPSASEIQAADDVMPLLMEIRSVRSRKAIIMCLIGVPRKIVAREFHIDRKTLQRWNQNIFSGLAEKCTRQKIKCPTIGRFEV